MMQITKLVPDNFEVPETLETMNYRLRMLTVNDVLKDYLAVISSQEQLVNLFNDDSPWPNGLTLEQNLIDLGWHQKEFQKRRSFAYTVVSLDDNEVLGCLYIYPSQNKEYCADIFLWYKESYIGEPKDEELLNNVKDWVNNEWPFKKVNYVGRK